MTYINIVKAVKALDEMQNLRLPYKKARDIWKARKNLSDSFDFYIHEEEKLIREYGSVDENGSVRLDISGNPIFKSNSDAVIFAAKLTELRNTECEVKTEPVELDGEDFGDIRITPEIISSLDGIVIFK